MPSKNAEEGFHFSVAVIVAVVITMFLTRFIGRRFLAVAASTRSESSTAAGAAAASTARIAKNPLEEFFEFDRSQDEDKPVVYG